MFYLHCKFSVPVTYTQSPTCEPPQKIACALDQNIKLDLRSDGCQQFICQCKPVEECDPIDSITEEPSEDGIVKVINHSGCCPTIELICKPELCPLPQECPNYYELKNSTFPGKCCPEYRCEQPKDACIFNPEYTADEVGGERIRNKYEKQQVLKKVRIF